MNKVWQHDWMEKWALYSPGRTALFESGSGSSVTYRMLNDNANTLGASLAGHFNIVRGKRIAVLDEMSIEYVTILLACQKFGYILVPMNYRLSSSEISEIISDSDPGLIIAGQSLSHLVDERFRDRIIHTESLDTLAVAAPQGKPEIAEDDPLFLIYTSGTTGKPKGVIYTHKMLFWNSINTGISLKINTDTVTVNVMPPFHTGGWNVLLMPILHHGGSVVLCKKFEAVTTLQLIEQFRCTVFMGVPTMLAFMAQEPAFMTTDLSSLDYIIVGGESMPIPLIEKYDAKGVAIRQGYGMTEVGPNLTSLHQDDAIRKKGSIGRPNFYVETRIVDEEGRDVPADVSGELWLRGPMVTPGYWNNPEETRKAFSGDGLWFRTGDIAVRDKDQYYYIVDRLKNMFISGAENVYPAEIERVISQVGGVKECAVVGVKDERWGEVGLALIVTSIPDLSPETVRAFCAQHLAKFKVPKHFRFIEELPKTESGKLDRKELRRKYA